jgi:CxxC-x17-CxxC domain-containing protein
VAFEDRSLRCVDCGTAFVWTAGEQAFYATRSLTHEPKRCRSCKGKHSEGHRDPRGGPRTRGHVETVARCTACGRDTTVPFRPAEGRPVYCRACFARRRHTGGR